MRSFEGVLVCGLVLIGCSPSLASAVAKGDAVTVQKYLARGDDPNARDGDGVVPLLAAAAVDRLDLAKLLVEKGAKLDARSFSDSGPTPLAAAAANGNLDVARFLVEKGAQVDAAYDVDEAHGEWLLGMLNDSSAAMLLDWLGGTKGWTPLMYAAFRGHREIVELFVDKGANVNTENAARLTPWMFALYQPLGEGPAREAEYRAIAKSLFTHGAKPRSAGAVVVFRRGALFTDGNADQQWIFGGPKPSWALEEIRVGAMNQILLAAFGGAGKQSVRVVYNNVQLATSGGVVTQTTTSARPIDLDLVMAEGGVYCVDYDVDPSGWRPRVDTYR
jgi:hypothetical protein